MAATRRVTKELADITKEPVDGVSVGVEDSNILKWVGTMAGPPDSPYKGGKFHFTVDFPLEYPFKAPVIKFTTRMYHMNIMDDGSICVGLLKAEAWKPSTKVDQVLRALYQLLQEPNPDDALVGSIAEVYRNDRAAHDREAANATKKWAS